MKIYIRGSEAVFAMSLPKHEIAARLEETTRTLIRHLIKLQLYGDTSPSANHWRQEIYAILHNVSKIRGSNKLPSQKFILDNTINVNRDLIPAWTRHIVTDYSDDVDQDMQIDVTKLEDKITDYYMWLAAELSEYGDISRTDCYNKLKELGC